MMPDIDLDLFCEKFDDPLWRIDSGIYKIITKGTGGSDLTVPFRLNKIQRQLLDVGLHRRNIILKARQLGMSTLVCIIWLDTCLFSKEPIQCGIIAHRREDAENMFRNKIKFAYDNLHPFIKQAFPLAGDSATELRFAHNGAMIRVSTSMRSDTIHRLHISEYGKICARYPDKALEISTGALNAVPENGIVVIESTAEGSDGTFYEMTKRAIALAQSGAKLSSQDYRFHFFPWFDEPSYKADPSSVIIPSIYGDYFDQIEAETGKGISPEQRAWYVAKCENDLGGDRALMWQEMPSTPDEAFRVSVEGCYYTRELAAARTGGRVCAIPVVPDAPVNTFWDLGHSGYSDATGVWFHQRVGPENRFLEYHEFEIGATLQDYARLLQGKSYIYGTHYLPHDAAHKLLGIDPDRNRSIAEMLGALLPNQKIEIVPRITEINTGILATRNVFPTCFFDMQGCAEGLKHLSNYRREWNDRRGIWTNRPQHDVHSHCADAFRQFGQVADRGEAFAMRAAESRIRRVRRQPRTSGFVL
jgi:hypothetical protein